MGDLTTRRAIEICMARLPMTGQVRDHLAQHLTAQRASPDETTPGDVEAMRADMQRILSEASHIDDRFSKAAMRSRFLNICDIVRRHD